MAEKVTLAVDACGGDNAPEVVLEGVKLALSEDSSLEIILCGPAEVVEPFCNSNERCTPCIAEQVIGMGEHPAEAVKAKKDSSIVVGCKLVREGRAQGFFSAGSTGACLVAATLHIGRIKGVKRPALGIVLPAYQKPALLLDVGANADVKVEYLVQFAQMGAAYMKAVMDVESPRVGLLNIGEEETKGSLLVQEAYGLMQRKVDSFCGNAEPSDLLEGKYDVVVSDGFTGNIALKTIEATAGLLFKMIKESLMSSMKSKIGAMLVKDGLSSLKSTVSPDAYGASPLLGVDGVCMVGHGSSKPEAVKNGILNGAREVRRNVKGAIAEAVSGKAASTEEGGTR